MKIAIQFLRNMRKTDSPAAARFAAPLTRLATRRAACALLASALLAIAIGVRPAYAQKYEFGLMGGGSFYKSKSIANPSGNADAGFSNGFSAGVSIGHNMYRNVGGEVRYTFLRNDLKLSAGNANATFGAQAHAIHYDILLYATPRGTKVRPFVSVGGGVKMFRGTGTEVPFQPLSNVALLTKTTDTKGLVSVGGGLQAALSDQVLFRVGIYDYISPFPKKVITPVLNSAVSGWLHNVLPMAGFTFTF